MVKVREGMVVHTNSERVRKARKVIYELVLSDHPKDCLSCTRNQSCELQKLGELLQVDDDRFEGEKSKAFIDDSSPSIVRDASKCILCRRCITVCNEIQGVGVLNVQKRGFKSVISPAGELPLYRQLRQLRTVYGRVPGGGAEGEGFHPGCLGCVIG